MTAEMAFKRSESRDFLRLARAFGITPRLAALSMAENVDSSALAASSFFPPAVKAR